MTRDDIIRIAQEVTGVNYPVSMSGVQIGMSHNHLERFAALLAAAEREAIIRLLDEMRHTDRDGVIASIQARGNK